VGWGYRSGGICTWPAPGPAFSPSLRTQRGVGAMQMVTGCADTHARCNWGCMAASCAVMVVSSRYGWVGSEAQVRWQTQVVRCWAAGPVTAAYLTPLTSGSSATTPKHSCEQHVTNGRFDARFDAAAGLHPEVPTTVVYTMSQRGGRSSTRWIRSSMPNAVRKSIRSASRVWG
jgi:hypothetical protein